MKFINSEKSRKARVGFLDELRGLSIILMVIFHGAYDLVYIFGFNIPIFHWGFLQNFLQPFFAGVFIVISGIACRYSNNNIKRGALVLAIALLMTLVTYFVMPTELIMFGILHFMGICMILYGVFALIKSAPLDKINPFWSSVICLALFAITFKLPYGYLGFAGTPLQVWLPDFMYTHQGLFMFGFVAPGFFSSDFYPLLPWMFLFFAGSFIGVFFKNNRMPSFFYRNHCKPLAVVGKHTLWIYLLHQPVILGMLTAISYLFGR